MATDREQAETVLEQTVVTFPHNEDLFEGVNDSVMTRTMEGIINFWNRSAESLYGWRKEEAVGRVSHDLLQTQFPKPLEEIESELVRNGRWEGRLVHTTRHGGRVAVQSRWTLDPTEQRGEVIEINAPSPDFEMDRETGTDSSTRQSERHEPLRTGKLVKVADIVLIAGGVFCLLVLFYIAYYYDWTGQRSFTSRVAEFAYFSLPGLLAIALLGSLGLRAPHRINVALCLFSAAASIYSVEAMMTLWFKLPSVISEQYRRIGVDAAQALGIQVDTRSIREVVHDFRSRGIDAGPSLFPQGLLKEQNDGTVKSLISINGVEFLPLASIANKLTVVCNENGQYLTYRSDEHGFNNPPHIWDTPIDIVAVGDSFTQGWCVDPESNFVSLIRQRHPGTLNLGIEGNGPLIMLATIKEYAESVKPKVVLWFHFEGNDLQELRQERQSPLLSRYLVTKEFSQNLVTRQAEIDRALADYLETIKSNPLLVKLQEISAVISRIDKLPSAMEDIIKLSQVRTRLRLVYGTKGETAQSEPARPRIEDRPQIDLLYEVLVQAKKLVSERGGTLYFIYLPSWNHYGRGERRVNVGRFAVLQAANKAGLPIVDIHRTFMAQKDPLALFPFGLAHHYNEEGHRLVAQEVLRAISSTIGQDRTGGRLRSPSHPGVGQEVN
jgi:PAS domain S-box-containing protein